MGLKHGAIMCWKCGLHRAIAGHISGTGSCLDCAQLDLVANIIGLTIPGSVERKHWEACYRISRPGRPKNTTPTQAAIAALPRSVLASIKPRWS